MRSVSQKLFQSFQFEEHQKDDLIAYMLYDYVEGYLDSKFTPSTFDNAVYLIKITDDGFFSIYSADEKTMYVENVKLGGSNQ